MEGEKKTLFATASISIYKANPTLKIKKKETCIYCIWIFGLWYTFLSLTFFWIFYTIFGGETTKQQFRMWWPSPAEHASTEVEHQAMQHSRRSSKRHSACLDQLPPTDVLFGQKRDEDDGENDTARKVRSPYPHLDVTVAVDVQSCLCDDVTGCKTTQGGECRSDVTEGQSSLT